MNPRQPLRENADPQDPSSYSLFHDQPDYSASPIQKEVLSFIDQHSDNPFFLYLPTPIPHVWLQAPQH